MEIVREMFLRMILYIYLEIFCDVFTSFIKLVLIKDDIKHLWRTLRKFFRRHQLDIDVARLSLTQREIF